ncbi:hypothetical protein COO91_04811 [Nostoc flagelliforme CCNUN1]|uniref:Uncharacterized protein n=1 Tax=Nostoc flagelliforme CCNUN1 TaxID=2038116 RepID=A0A2K8STN5_9NOSO|nr:hypothetical protein COO91_04811 [Nostoc flagelliforme CCNUN1]
MTNDNTDWVIKQVAINTPIKSGRNVQSRVLIPTTRNKPRNEI